MGVPFLTLDASVRMYFDVRHNGNHGARAPCLDTVKLNFPPFHLTADRMREVGNNFLQLH
jgi:hypothetical protein